MPDPKKPEVNPIFGYLDKALTTNNPIFVGRVSQYLAESEKQGNPITQEEARMLTLIDVMQSNKDNPIEKKPLMLGNDMINGLRRFTSELSGNAGFNVFDLEEKQKAIDKQMGLSGNKPDPFKQGYTSDGEYIEYYDAEAIRPKWSDSFWSDKYENRANDLMAEAFKRAGIDLTKANTETKVDFLGIPMSGKNLPLLPQRNKNVYTAVKKGDEYHYTSDYWDIYDKLDDDVKKRVQKGLMSTVNEQNKEEVKSRAKDTFLDNIQRGALKGIFENISWRIPIPLDRNRMEEYGIRRDLTDREVVEAFKDEIKDKTPEELEGTELQKMIDDYAANRNSVTEAALEMVGLSFGVVATLGATKAILGEKLPKLFKLADTVELTKLYNEVSGVSKLSSGLSKAGIVSKYLLANVGWGVLNPMGQLKMGLPQYLFNSPYRDTNVDNVWEDIGLMAYHTITPGLEQLSESIFIGEPLRLAKLGIRFHQAMDQPMRSFMKKAGQGILSAIEIPVTENLEEELTNMIDEAVYPSGSKQSVILQGIRKALGSKEPWDLSSQEITTWSTLVTALLTRGMSAGMIKKFNDKFGENAHQIFTEVVRRAQSKGLDEKVFKEVLNNIQLPYEARILSEAKQENAELMAGFIVGRDQQSKLEESDLTDKSDRDFLKIHNQVEQDYADKNKLTRSIIKGLWFLQPEHDLTNLKSGTLSEYYLSNIDELEKLTSETIKQLRTKNVDTENAIATAFETNNNFGLTNKQEIEELKLSALLSVPIITDTEVTKLELNKYKDLDQTKFKAALESVYINEGVQYGNIMFKTLLEHKKNIQEFIKSTQDEVAKENAVKELEEIDKRIDNLSETDIINLFKKRPFQNVLLTEILGTQNIKNKFNGDTKTPVSLEVAEKAILGKENTNKKYMVRIVESLEAISKQFDPAKTKDANELPIKATRLLAQYYLTNRYEKDLENYDKQFKSYTEQKIKEFYKQFPQMVDEDRFRASRAQMWRMLPPNKINAESYKFFEELGKEIWDGKFSLIKAIKSFRDTFKDTPLEDKKIESLLKEFSSNLGSLKQQVTGTKQTATATPKSNNSASLSGFIESSLFAPAFTNIDTWEVTGNKQLDDMLKTYLKMKTTNEQEADKIAGEFQKAFENLPYRKGLEAIERLSKLIVSTLDNSTLSGLSVYKVPEYLKPLLEKLTTAIVSNKAPEFDFLRDKIAKNSVANFSTSILFLDFFISTKSTTSILETLYSKIKDSTPETPAAEPAPVDNLVLQKRDYVAKQEVWKRSTQAVKDFIDKSVFRFVLDKFNLNDPEAYRKVTQEEMSIFESEIKAFLNNATEEDIFSFFFVEGLFKHSGIGDEQYKHLKVSSKITTMLRYYAHLALMDKFRGYDFDANDRTYVIPVKNISTEDRAKIYEKVSKDQFKTFPVKGTWEDVLKYFGMQGDENLASRLRMIYRQHKWGKDFVNNENSKFIQYHYTFISEDEIDSLQLNPDEKTLFRQLVSGLGMQNIAAHFFIPMDTEAEMDLLIKRLEGKVFSKEFVDKANVIISDFNRSNQTQYNYTKFNKISSMILGNTGIVVSESEKLAKELSSYLQAPISIKYVADLQKNKGVNASVVITEDGVSIEIDKTREGNLGYDETFKIHELLHPFTLPLFDNKEFVDQLDDIYNKLETAFRDKTYDEVVKKYFNRLNNSPGVEAALTKWFDAQSELGIKKREMMLTEFLSEFFSGTLPVYWLMSHIEDNTAPVVGGLISRLRSLLKENIVKYLKDSEQPLAKNLANRLENLVEDAMEEAKLLNGIKLETLIKLRPLIYEDDNKSYSEFSLSFDEKPIDSQKSDDKETGEKFLVDSGVIEQVDLLTNYDSQFAETMSIDVSNLNRMIDEIAYVLGYNSYGVEHYAFIQSLTYEEFAKVFDPANLNTIKTDEGKLKAKKFLQLLDNALDYDHTVRPTSLQTLRDKAIRNIYVTIKSLFQAPHYSITNEEVVLKSKSIEDQIDAIERNMDKEGATLVRLGSTFKVETGQGKITRSSYRYKVKLIEQTDTIATALGINLELSFINDFFGKGFHYKNQSLFDSDEFDPKFQVDPVITTLLGRDSNTAKVAKLIYSNRDFSGLYLLPFADKSTYPFWKVDTSKESMDQITERVLIPIYNKYLEIFKPEGIQTFDPTNKAHYPYIASMVSRLLVEELKYDGTIENVREGKSKLAGKNFIEMMKRHTPVIELRTLDFPQEMIDRFIKAGIVSTKIGDAYYWGKLGQDTQDRLYVNVAVAAFKNDDRFKNETGQFIFDGQSLYIIGQFDKINMELSGSINEGVIKNVMLFQGLFGKHTLQGINKNEALAKIFGSKVGVIIMDANEKNTSKGETRTINYNGQQLPVDNTYEDFQNNTAKTFYVPFDDFHRIQETHNNKTTTKGTQQIINSSGITVANTVIEDRLVDLVNKVTSSIGKKYAEKYLDDFNVRKEFVTHLVKVIRSPQGNKQKLLSIMFNDLGKNKGILTEGDINSIYDTIKYFNQMPLLYDAMADYLGSDVTKAVKYELSGTGATLSADGGNWFPERVAIARSQQREFILKDKEAFNSLYPEMKNRDAYFGDLQSLFKLQREIDYYNYLYDTVPLDERFRPKRALIGYKAEKRVLIDTLEKHLQATYEGHTFAGGDYSTVEDLFSKVMPPDFAEKIKDYENKKFNENFKERDFLKPDAVYISIDEARRLKLRVGDTGVTEITPSDSAMGLKGVTIAGILPLTHINPSTIIMNSEYIQGVGKDFDADKVSFVVYDPSMGITEAEWNEFVNLSKDIWKKYVNKVYDVFSDLNLVPKGLTGIYEKMRAAFAGEAQTAYMKDQLGERTDVKTFYSPIDPAIFYLSDVFHKDVGYVVTLRQLHQLLGDIGLKFNIMNSTGTAVYKSIDFSDPEVWFKAHTVMMILTNHQVDYPKTIDKDYYNHSPEYIFANMMGIDYGSAPAYVQRVIKTIQNAVTQSFNLFMNVPREGSKTYVDSYDNSHYISKTQHSIYKLSEASRFVELLGDMRARLDGISGIKNIEHKQSSQVQYPIKSMLDELNGAFSKANGLLPYISDSIRKDFMKNIEHNILLNMIFNSVDETNNKLFPITANILNLFTELETSPWINRLFSNDSPGKVTINDTIFNGYSMEEKNLGLKYLYALKKQFSKIRDNAVIGDRQYFEDTSEYLKWQQQQKDTSSKSKRYHLADMQFKTILPLLNKQDAFLEAWYEWNLTSAYQGNLNSPEYKSQKRVMDLWRALHFLFTGESELTKTGRSADKKEHHIEYAKQRDHIVDMLDVVLNKTSRFVFKDIKIESGDGSGYVIITSYQKGNKVQYYDASGKLMKESATLRGNAEAYKILHNPATFSIDPSAGRETSIARDNRAEVDAGLPLNFANNITFEEKMKIAVNYIKQYVQKTGMTKAELNRTLISMLGIKTDPTAGKNLFVPGINLTNDNLYVLMGIFAPELLFHYRDLYTGNVQYNANMVEDIRQKKQDRAGYLYSAFYIDFESGSNERILEIAENEIPATENIDKFKKLSYDEKVKAIINLAEQVDILKTARAMGTSVQDMVLAIRNDLDGFVRKISATQTSSVIKKLEQTEQETIRKDKVLNMVYRELTELKTTYKTVPLVQPPGTVEQWRSDGKYDLALAWKYDIPEYNNYTDRRKDWMFAIPNYEGWFIPDVTNPDAFYSIDPSAVISDLSAFAFQEEESGLRQFGAIALTAAKFKRLSLQLSALQRDVNTTNANRDNLVRKMFDKAVDRTDIAQFEARVRQWERKLIKDNNFSVATVGKTGYKLFYRIEEGGQEKLIVKREDEIDEFIDEYINANNLNRADEELKLILKGAIATRVLYNYRIPSVINRTLFYLDHLEKFAIGTAYYQDIQIMKSKYKRFRYYLLTNADEEFEFDKKTKKKNFFLKVYETKNFIKEYQNHYYAEKMVKENISKEEALKLLKKEAELKVGTDEFYIPFFKDFKDNNIDGDIKQFSADGIFVDRIIQTIGSDIRSIYAMQFLDYATKNRVPKVAVESMIRFMQKQTNSLRFTTKIKAFDTVKQGDYVYFYVMPEGDYDDIDEIQNEVQGKIIAPALKRGKVSILTDNTIQLEGDDKTYAKDKIYGVNTTDSPKIGFVMEYKPKNIADRIGIKQTQDTPLTLMETMYSKVVQPIYRGMSYSAGKLTLGHWLVKPGFWLFNSLGGYLQMAMYMGAPTALKALRGTYKQQREALNAKQVTKEELDLINGINSVSGYGNTVLNILGQSSDIDSSPESLAYFATSSKTKETKKRLRLFNIGQSDKNLVNYHRAMKNSPEYRQIQDYIESKRALVEELTRQRETASPEERVAIEEQLNQIKDYISILVNNTYLTEDEINSTNDDSFKEVYRVFKNSKDIKFYMPYDLTTLKKLVKKYKQDKESKSESLLSINRLEARLRGDAFLAGYEHAKHQVGLEHEEALEYAMNFVDHTQGFYADFARRINEDSQGRKVYYALHQFTLNMIRSLRVLHRDVKYNVMLNGLESYLNLSPNIAIDKEGKVVPIKNNRQAIEAQGGKVIGRNYGIAALNMLWINGMLFGASYYIKGVEFLIHPALAPFMILGKVLIDAFDPDDKEPKENDIWMMMLQFLSLKMGFGGSFMVSAPKSIAESIEKKSFESLQWVIPKTPRVGMGYINMLKEDREGKTYAQDKFMMLLKGFTRLGVSPRFGTVGLSNPDEGLSLLIPYYPDIKEFGVTEAEEQVERKMQNKERSMKRKQDIIDDLEDYIRYKQGLPKRKIFGLEVY